MRHGPAGRRLRNRGGGGGGGNNGNNGGGQRRHGGGNNRNQVFDSNGPDVRIRGTAHQIQEKYATLAKDAAASGDLIQAESYLQHAEHYQRVINSWIEQSGGYQAYEDNSDDGFVPGRFEPKNVRHNEPRPDIGNQAQPVLPSDVQASIAPAQPEHARSEMADV